jgi:acetoin utilization deacetylase AcuC-like enzyme
VGDPLGRFNITVDGYAQMIKMLTSLANGNMIVALEVVFILFFC